VRQSGKVQLGEVPQLLREGMDVMLVEVLQEDNLLGG
jgi:hypothetical protein